MGDQLTSTAISNDGSLGSWLRTNLFDLTLVALASVLMLRFWYIVFGVEDARVIAILTTAALCEFGRCALLARRSGRRPQFVAADRRSDLLAAIAIATAPWPVTLPVRAASALWSLCPPATIADSVRPLCAVVVLLLALRRVEKLAQ
jgi:hypothetical protein